MKKKNLLFLITIALLSSAINLHAKKIIVEKFGSADGIHYDRVRESHTNPIFGEDTHTLRCKGSGNIECKWEFSPWIVGNTQNWDYYEFISIIEKRIKDSLNNMQLTTIHEFIIIDGIKVKIDAAIRENNLIDYTLVIEDNE